MKLTFCVACGKTEGLHHHHLLPKVLGGTDDDDNMITLCEFHHGIAHGVEGRFSNHKTLVARGYLNSKDKGIRFGPKYKRPNLSSLLRNSKLVTCDYMPALLLFSFGYYVRDIAELRWRHLSRIKLNGGYRDAILNFRPEDARDSDFILPAKKPNATVEQKENTFNVYKTRIYKKFDKITLSDPPATANDLIDMHKLIGAFRNTEMK